MQRQFTNFNDAVKLTLGSILYYPDHRGINTTAQNELLVARKNGIYQFAMHNLHQVSWRNFTASFEDNLTLDAAFKKSGKVGLGWGCDKAGVDVEISELLTGDRSGHIGIGAWFRVNDRVKAHLAQSTDVTLPEAEDRSAPQINPQAPSLGLDLQPHKRAGVRLAFTQFSTVSALLKLSLPQDSAGILPKSDFEISLRGDLKEKDFGYGFRWTGSLD